MTNDFACPVCGQADWTTIGTHGYDVRRNGLSGSEYDRERWKIFFSVWFNGADTVLLRTQLCEGCGFMTYTPRPDADDLEAYYQQFEKRFAAIDPTPFEQLDLATQRRIRNVHRFVSPFHNAKHARILDFGGAQGYMLAPFLAEGHFAEVVDHLPNILPGITLRGARIDDLDPEIRYDLILCCHVIEHLDQPGPVLSALRNQLHEKGLLYVEVPNEIWRDIPIAFDPITHVNFFNPCNLEYLCAQHGLEAVAIREGIEVFDVWSVKVTGLLLRKCDSVVLPDPSEGLRYTRRLLSPSLVDRFLHALKVQVPIKVRRAMHAMRSSH